MCTHIHCCVTYNHWQINDQHIRHLRRVKSTEAAQFCQILLYCTKSQQQMSSQATVHTKFIMVFQLGTWTALLLPTDAQRLKCTFGFDINTCWSFLIFICKPLSSVYSPFQSYQVIVKKTVSLQNSSQNFADNNQGVELNRERRV